MYGENGYWDSVSTGNRGIAPRFFVSVTPAASGLGLGLGLAVCKFMPSIHTPGTLLLYVSGNIA